MSPRTITIQIKPHVVAELSQAFGHDIKPTVQRYAVEEMLACRPFLRNWERLKASLEKDYEFLAFDDQPVAA
jgi:hypothetical protein